MQSYPHTFIPVVTLGIVHFLPLNCLKNTPLRQYIATLIAAMLDPRARAEGWEQCQPNGRFMNCFVCKNIKIKLFRDLLARAMAWRSHGTSNDDLLDQLKRNVIGISACTRNTHTVLHISVVLIPSETIRI